MNRDSALEGSRTGLAEVRFPWPARRRVKAHKPFWTRKEWAKTVDLTVGTLFRTQRMIVA
jgi:hypothetical protein